MLPLSNALPWDKKTKPEEEHDKNSVKDLEEWKETSPVHLQLLILEKKPMVIEMPPKSKTVAVVSPRSNISGGNADKIDDLSILDVKMEKSPINNE